MSEIQQSTLEKFSKGASSSEEALQLVQQITGDGINLDGVQKLYEYWADNYELDMKLLHVNAPKQTARELLSYFYYNRDALILDCAAGTGLCGQELADNGMRNLHCLDLSAAMLRKAMARGIYKKSIVAELGPNRIPEISENTYDGVLMCATSFIDHEPLDYIPELIRIVKPGGYIVLGHGTRPTAKEELALMNLYEARGLWKQMMHKYIPHFSNVTDEEFGNIWSFQVLSI